MIVILVGEVLFSTKITQTAKELGLEVTSTKSAEQFKEAVHLHAPTLVIVDLSMKSKEPFDAVKFLKEYDATNFGTHSLKIVGFLSHVEKDIQERAEREGLKNIMPRSLFSKNLPQILKGEGLL